VLSIQALHAQGWSQRRIARELGISRHSVSKHLKAAGVGDSKCATSAKAPGVLPKNRTM
jgi:predicted transcriptional regulator